jgi:hypothetical protein
MKGEGANADGDAKEFTYDCRHIRISCACMRRIHI